MGLGLVSVGAAGYVFLAVAGRTLSSDESAAVASFYLLANIIGPGLFVALEQETSRSTSRALAHGRPSRPSVMAAARHGAVLLVSVLAVLALSAPVLVSRPLTGHWALYAALLLVAPTSAAVYLVRGLLGGLQRFTGYASTLLGEGISRLVLTGAVAVMGVRLGWVYAVAYSVAIGMGAVTGLRWVRGTGGAAVPSAPARDGDVSGTTDVSATTDGADVTAGRGDRIGRGLSQLFVATLMAQVVANLAPVVVTARLTHDTATAAAFAAAFVMVRIPLFIFAPVQAMLLPALTRAAAHRELGQVRRRVRQIMVAVLLIGGLGAGCSAVLGPWAVQVIFGAKVQLSGATLGALGISTVALMTAQVLQPALIALDEHGRLTLVWVAGTTLLVGLLLLPTDAMLAAVIAQLAGGLVVVVGMSAVVRSRLGSRRASPSSGAERSAASPPAAGLSKQRD
jgi:O-antigen/teichoic acid export membrane protein